MRNYFKQLYNDICNTKVVNRAQLISGLATTLGGIITLSILGAVILGLKLFVYVLS